jgi:hypothetical protein
MFDKGYLHDFLNRKGVDLDQEISGFERDYLLNASENDICDYLIKKYTLEIPRVNIEAKDFIENRPIMVTRQSMYRNGAEHVQGQFFALAIPFEGDPALLNYIPSRQILRTVEARISDNELVLHYQIADDESQQFHLQLDADIKFIREELYYVELDITNYHNRLTDRVKKAVAERKRILLNQLNFVGSLNIPVRRRESVPQTYAVPSVKRRPRIERPVVSSGAFKPEPALPVEEYEHILSVTQNMAVMLERSPSTFAKLSEEEIRDHFLVQLNGHYEGRATGETFNRDGKTDILIRDNNQNVFISECKFWGGAKAFGGIIDQLLGYASWRDTKMAIFLFNRNKATSKVLEQIPGLVKAHANFKREFPGRLDETRFRYVLHQKGDANRELLLTVCVFDIPST